MYDRSIVDLVDNAIDRRRLCTACGTPNSVITEDGALYVVCSKLSGESSGRLAWLSALLFPHDRVQILP